MTSASPQTAPAPAAGQPTALSGPWPSPAIVAILALLAGVLGVVLRWDGYSWPSEGQGPGRVVQALWFFPTAAWGAVRLMQKLRWGRPTTLKGRLFWSLPAYLLISVLSTMLFSTFILGFVTLGESADDSLAEALGIVLFSQVVANFNPATLLGFWMLLASDSPVAFAAFAAGLVALSLLGPNRQLPDLAGHNWTRGGTVLMALSLLACAVWWTASFKSAREKTLEKHETWQLQRIGLLIGTTDQERAAALASAQQARGGTALALWLQQQPTKSTYTVGPGKRDFLTLTQALDHLERIMNFTAPTSFVNEVDSHTAQFFTLETGAGTYTGPLKLVGPVQIRNEGVAGSVMLRSGDPLKPVISLEYLKQFKHAPALIGATVWGGSEVPAVYVAGEDTGGVLIENNTINGAGPTCALEGGGLIRKNQFRGSCGVALNGVANLHDNNFTAVTGSAISVSGKARADIRGNRYATAPAGPLIWAAQDAQAEIEERTLHLTGSKWAVLLLGDNAKVTLRSSQLSNPGSACIWLATGTPVIDIVGTRFEACGNASFPSVQADSGGKVIIRSSTFTAVPQRATLQTLVSADKGAKLTIETSAVE